jgi:hypothetical protein
MTVGGCNKSQRPLFRGATPLRAGPLVHSPFPLAPRRFERRGNETRGKQERIFQQQKTAVNIEKQYSQPRKQPCSLESLLFSSFVAGI